MLFVGGLETIHPLFENKGGESLGVVLVFGDHGNDVGNMGVGDKTLAAGNDVVVPVLRVDGAAAGRVRPSRWFRYSHGRQQFSRGELWKIFLLLGLGSKTDNGIDPQRKNLEHHCRGDGNTADLLERDHPCNEAKPQSAIFLGDRDCHHLGLSQRFDEVRGHLRGFFHFRHKRRYPVFSELTRRLSEHFLLFSEREINH